MEKETFKALLKKYEDGQCTSEETAYVESWFLKIYKETLPLDATPDYDAVDVELRTRLGLRSSEVRPPSKTYSVRMVLRYVAAILAFLTVAFSIYWYSTVYTPRHSLSNQYVQDIPPGGNRATLSFSNGNSIALNENKDGIIAGTEQYVYSDGETVSTIQTDTEYATLTTPRGGQYHIMLPDGSRVWLNAASSIKYPVHFSGNGRHVEMSGEAYFEIAHDADRPFTVTTAAQSVTVLGTSFNINAYEDETFTATTLVTGRVHVNSIANEETKTLQPGEQAILENGELTTYQVDANDFTVWKSGVITLHYAKLPAIFRQIERWYDVSFVVNEKLPEDDLYGELQRNANLSEVLAALEINTGMKFRIEGRRVIVGR
ncbi:FecR family protein [Parapedobacter sp. 2B3]|uniref:FecR family protein n=1 Tax=Parapedobacter sp. 2B3 TaxID=3342381 RepID=UPI0035B60BD0